MIRSESKKIKSLAVISLLLTTILFTYSCIEDVPMEILPKTEPKLVISSFITPGDTIRVRVFKSFPVNYNYTYSQDYLYGQFPPVVDAVVSIRNTNTGDTVSIPYDSFGFYILSPADFSIEEGEVYELRVTHAELGEATAQTTVPDTYPELLSISIDTVVISDPFYDEDIYEFVITGTIKDPPGISNFYRSVFSFYTCYYDAYYDSTYCYRAYATDKGFSDFGKDGQVLSFSFNTYGYGLSWEYYSLSLLSTDAHYYQYHRSLYYWDESFPFAEPSFVYSNVKDGLGVFGSYVEKVYEYDDAF